MQNIINRYRDWFENDVNYCIKPIVEEFINESNYTKDEAAEYINDSKLRNGTDISEQCLHYLLLSEPCIDIKMDFNINDFTVLISYQIGISQRYQTNNLCDLARFWNTYILNNFGSNCHLPEMPNLS